MSFIEFITDFFDDADDMDEGVSHFETHLEELHSQFNIPVDVNLNDVLDSSDDLQVLYALDRMTNSIEDLNIAEIKDYLDDYDFDSDSFTGLISNWKGIYGEIQAVDHLNENFGDDLDYVIPDSTNNPGVDIYGLDDDGKIAEMYQVKMTLNPSYIQQTLEELPDHIKVVCPTEIADTFDDVRVVDLGISHADILEDIDNVSYIIKNFEPWEISLQEDTHFGEWLDDSDFSQLKVG
ncbi:MAG: hypothetical protein KAG61_04955 [Bacteriovoracaceae bacterium]|nr:hypothetical protein [Bacteriovoracaceae bacterium]